jgi:hypothetical protein
VNFEVFAKTERLGNPPSDQARVAGLASEDDQVVGSHRVPG